MLSTLQKYLVIVFNRKNVRFLSTPWQPYVLLMTWIVASLTALPHSLGDVYVWMWRDFCVCISSWAEWIDCVTMSVIVVLPLVSIPIIYAHIWFVVRRSSLKVAHGKGVKKTSKAARTAFILFILYLAFVIGYSPYLVYTFIVNRLSANSMKVTFNVIWCMVFLVSACNPLLYLLLFSEFRQSFRRLFKKDISIGPESEMTVTQTQIQTIE